MKNFVIYGFTKDEILKMKNLIRFVSSNINYITVCDEDFSKTLGEVIENNLFNEENNFSLDEKIVVFQNCFPKEIDVYFKILKSKLSKKIMFASVTENSINMKIEDLFNEFKMEREYFKKNK